MATESSKNNLGKKPKGTWGGKQPNAGRKKGGKNKNVLEREEALRQFRERVASSTNKIFEAQLNLAIGETYLMVIRTVGKGAKARRETEIVTNPHIIKDYFDGKLGESDEEYYFISTKPANNQALDSLMNRTFGRPKEDSEDPDTLHVKFEVVNKVPGPKTSS